MTTSWKDTLQNKMASDLERQIDIFEGQIELRKQGKLDEKVFAETRLRRGVYGQRYNADGTPSGSEFRVNTYTSGHQYDPSVTALKDGGFMVSNRARDRLRKNQLMSTLDRD